MAVTRQLARLTEDVLARCRASVDELDAVCSFTALDADDYLDLDWAPRLLARVVRSAALPDGLVAALDLAVDGIGEVNPAYRDVQGSVWEHPVSSLAAADVVRVSAGLTALAGLGFPEEQAVRAAVAGVSAVPADPVQYVKQHFDALHDFYAEAAASGLAVVTWWD